MSFSGYRVTAVGSGRAFYRALDDKEFTVALIDIGLPDQSGLVLAEYLRANTTTGVIVLTARDTEGDQLSGYEAGADLYLTKPVNSRVLGSAIARLAERLKDKSGAIDVTTSGHPSAKWTLSREKWTLISPQGYAVTLTSLEFRFLEMLTQSKERQGERECLLATLYHQPDDYSGRALDALVRRLRNKLTRMPVPASPIKSVYGVGYCFSEQIMIK